MQLPISLGNQGFASLRENHCFYIDKTDFIREWWEEQDVVTLITRPRRFGKTLNLNMMECFFSIQYKDRSDLFEDLSIWNDQKYHELQGTYPVISLSFANIKGRTFEETKRGILQILVKLFSIHSYIKDDKILNSEDWEFINSVNMDMPDDVASLTLMYLSDYLSRFYQKKVLIFLDEYDTPLQEAYIHGYWDELTGFLRSLLNASFKTNPYLERGLMTGITRISKESIFSDLNNLSIITTTSEKYSQQFGFTENEVFKALKSYHLSDKESLVKSWYDGFTFGSQKDIYNPWSITCFLKEKLLKPYWVHSSSNALISKLLQISNPETKMILEDILNGGCLKTEIDEEIIFDQLEKKRGAIWSLLLASGYLKVDSLEKRGLTLEPWYHLSITNLETVSMFSNMFRGWFNASVSNYNGFIRALLRGNVKEMNIYMNEVALSTFSSFDSGKHPSGKSEPERFYHGFVLGLLVELRDKYEVQSNRESGYGRYDVMIIPRDKNSQAVIIEFKVIDSQEETSLDMTADSALKQIEEKNYDAKLLERGYKREAIQHYGFAFEGKKVLIKKAQI
mgnify:CR=1 FL=1